MERNDRELIRRELEKRIAARHGLSRPEEMYHPDFDTFEKRFKAHYEDFLDRVEEGRLLRAMSPETRERVVDNLRETIREHEIQENQEKLKPGYDWDGDPDQETEAKKRQEFTQKTLERHIFRAAEEHQNEAPGQDTPEAEWARLQERRGRSNDRERDR